MAIPPFVFQTHKSISYLKKKPALLRAVASWRRYAPRYRYFFYTDSMCDAFMKETMGGDVYRAYCKLPMAVMKADLWRYCIVYWYGGIYADVDTVCCVDPDLFRRVPDSFEMVVVPEMGHPYFCQWVFAAPPRSAMLWEIIQESVRRILDIKYFLGEELVHYLTGPAVFTDGIENYLRKQGLSVFANKHAYVRRYRCLGVFDPRRFHQDMVQHLFAGSDEDGWKQERDRRLTINASVVP
jgi:mannosyltransferase OCH1-like enzyme